jgi:hydroxypyruvate reductase
LDSHKFATKTLLTAPWGASVARVLAAAVAAVDPYAAVARKCGVADNELQVGGNRYALDAFENIYVVGAGKAGLPMTQAVFDLLGERITAGQVIVKEGHASRMTAVENVILSEAGHPLPDQRGVAATEQILELLAKTTQNDLVVCLISGGGSALLTAPVPGVSLDDLRALTDALLASGATIFEINALRKHLDRVKGGKLAKAAAPAQVLTLVLSDVIGDPLDIIASGPTVPDPNTYADAITVVEKYALGSKIPASIMDHLLRGVGGDNHETPKPGNPLFEQVRNVLVGNNEMAARAALEQAEKEGFDTMLLTTSLQGEAREVGRALAAILRQIAASGDPRPRPVCIVAGGETTVTLRGSGKGGRNQELTLGAVADLAGLDNVALVTLATDGGDGPTDAAGAVVTGETLARAHAAGLDVNASLANNDAYAFFDAMGDLLKPGPTQTNVNDLTFLFGVGEPGIHGDKGNM